MEAARKFGLKLNLRGLEPNSKTGLSYSKKKCDASGENSMTYYGYPCYSPRELANNDDGEYVSIEWSNEYLQLAKGYYIVVVASGPVSITKPVLIKSKKFYKDAFMAYPNINAEPIKEKGFVIIKSTKNYNVAKKIAIEASQKLGIKLDLKAVPNKTTGLTFSKEDCEGPGEFGYPCYTARGRYDDGEYISIEWSNAYENFSKGYYIVVLASGNPEAIKTTLVKAQPVYKDAFIKLSNIYMGCIH